MSSSAVVDLLRTSLDLWQVGARLEAGTAPVVAIIVADDGTVLTAEAAGTSERPVRWWVRWHRRADSPHAGAALRSRPCASAIGLLATLRDALGAEAGQRLRIGAVHAASP